MTEAQGRLVFNTATGETPTAFYVVNGKFARMSLTTLGRLSDNETKGATCYV